MTHEPRVELDGETATRAALWASTMQGHQEEGVVFAHREPGVAIGENRVLDRLSREEEEAQSLVSGATLSRGAGERRIAEEPDPFRTCFERDRDRILHSNSFRRLAGKTQVFIFPDDHQRTRLTHALEVAQVATAIARALRLNVALTEAIALAHDCGHGPGGHPSEDAFAPYLEGGYDHAVWGAEVTLAPLNLTREVTDGICNHSWSRPRPCTPEGEVVSWADRAAYCAHDLEDAIAAGIVSTEELPRVVIDRCGVRRDAQLNVFVRDLVLTSATTGQISMSSEIAEALAALRTFNYERIYARDDSVAQGQRVIKMLRALVDHYSLHPIATGEQRPLAGEQEAIMQAINYVGGMTDRYACAQAVELFDWPEEELPRGLDLAIHYQSPPRSR